MLPSASEIATGRWHGILPALGVAEEFLRNKHGPCPMCGGKDRWRFDDKRGKGTWFCNGCGNGDGYQLLMAFHGWNFREAAEQVKRVVGFVDPSEQPRETDEARAIANCRKVWEDAEKVTSGDPVWQYLHRRTGIDLIPASLRYHPALPYRHGDGSVSYHPAMVAMVSDEIGAGVTIHRTYLTSDGNKANVRAVRKLMPGKPLAGASIKLGAVAECIGIAEGIETALAASRAFKAPVWACVSAHGLETWKPTEGIARVIVFGDNDEKFAGQAAAYRIAHRLAVAGIAAGVRIPETVGTDWADAWTT